MALHPDGHPELLRLHHGHRISDEEYQRRIVELYSSVPARPSKIEEEALRRQEFNLTIDHRLGKEFPIHRREALWRIQQQVEGKRSRLVLGWLIHALSRRWLTSRTGKLAGYLVKEYGKVLTKPELSAYFNFTDEKES